MVNLKNEIHIKIDNSNRQPVKKISKRRNTKPRLTEEQKEDLATQQLDNLYYDNHALMTQHHQGQSRGSGGSIILPPSTSDTNKNSYFSSSENNPNSNPNLSGNFFNSLYKQLQNSSSSSINTELNKPSSNYNPAYTDPQKITKNTSNVKISFPRGRPPGSKNKPKANEPNAPTEEVKFESPVQQPMQPSHSIFDNPESQPTITEPDENIIISTKKIKRPRKTSEIGKKDKSKPRKGVVLRPDNDEL